MAVDGPAEVEAAAVARRLLDGREERRRRRLLEARALALERRQRVDLPAARRGQLRVLGLAVREGRARVRRALLQWGGEAGRARADEGGAYLLPAHYLGRRELRPEPL